MIDKKDAEQSGFKTIDSNVETSICRQDKLEQLHSIFPELINGDGLLDIKALKNLLGVAGYATENQGYGLNFAGKGLARIKADEPTHKELQVEKEQSKDFDTTENIIIRGDNLDALKILRQNYEGKIRSIYIDPPYNTDTANFVYNDSFKESEAELIERYSLDEDAVQFFENVFGTKNHSGWLFAMYPRLKLARDLLTEDGVIFISIGDNEQANLKIMCDEIFGEYNFISHLFVEMSVTQGMKVATAQKGEIVKNGEFVLVYGKDRNLKQPFQLLYEKREWDTHYSIYYDSVTGDRRTLKEYLREKIDAGKIPSVSKNSLDNISHLYERNEQFRQFVHEDAEHICRDAVCQVKLNFSEEEKKQLEEGKIISVSKLNKSYTIFKNSNGVIRQLINLAQSIGDTHDFQPWYGLRKIRGDWWKGYYKDMMNIATEGGVEFKNGKKPVRLIRDILNMVTSEGDIVLDFFAGSGTTAHAVMDLNKEDGGKRKFILVQRDEEIDSKTSKSIFDFCKKNDLQPVISSICIERVNRAGDKIKEEAGLLENGLDIGYKVFSLTEKPKTKTDEDGKLRLHIDRQTATDTLYNMMAASGEVLLDDAIEEIEADKLYKVRSSYFVLGECETDLRKVSVNSRVYIDGYAQIGLLKWLNMLGLNKDLVRILY